MYKRQVYSLIESRGDLALIVGGYNSSNTSHLVELCEQHLPAFHIKDAGEILDQNSIRHLDYKSGQVIETLDWFPHNREKVDILVTAGASCPDALVDQVLRKVASLSKLDIEVSSAIESFSL